MGENTGVLRLHRDVEELDGVAAAGRQQQLLRFRQIHNSMTQCGGEIGGFGGM